MGNHLIKAVELFDQLMEAETEIERAVRGGEEFLLIDEKLTDEIHCLVLKSSVSGEALSRRARIARLNLIWNDFLKEHAAKMTASAITKAEAGEKVLSSKKKMKGRSNGHSDDGK
jgi:hypothetical protein